MKTIFITAFHPIISRNILSTPILSGLISDKEIRVVIVSRDKKVPFFTKEFASKQVLIEGIPTKRNKRDRFFQYFSFSSVRSESLRLKRLTELSGQGKYVSFFLANRCGRFLIRTLTQFLVRDSHVEALFEKYKPDLLFATDIQNDFDIRMLVCAKRRGIKNVGMVRSWDNPASKGLIRFVPEQILVQSDRTKIELTEMHGINPAFIEVVGIPHYDRYVKERMTRVEAAKIFGINPRHSVLLFTPIGDRYVAENTVDRDILSILDATLPKEWIIIVRLPFSDTVSFLDEQKSSGRIIFDRPDPHFTLLKNNELSISDERHLIATLSLTDLIATGPSTIAVDGAFFDIPVVLIAFDGNEKRPFLQSVKRYYSYNHWKPILESGGVRYAENKEAFISALKEYREYPARDKDGRAKIARVVALDREGKSSERIIAALQKML